MTTITKKELVKEVTETLKANEWKISQKDVTDVLDTAVEAICAHLENGEGVRLPGFATFEVVEVAAKEGRNPATGESMTIAAHKKLKTKVSTTLKERIR